MRAFIFAAVIAMALAHAQPDPAKDQDWAMFKEEHGKTYDAQSEDLFRRLVWEDNMNYVETHNAQADAGLHSYRLGSNEYADLTNEEFNAQFLGTHLDTSKLLGFDERPTIDQSLKQMQAEAMPDMVDWRPKGYVTEVKNQKQCGSCWSFSATGSMEGQHFKKMGKLVSLSEQNLMDCSTKEGNMGCNGGLMDQAFQYVIKNKGVDTEMSYPYTARDGQCHYNPANMGATISSYKDIPTHNETALQAAVATIGPISVAIDASKMSFQLYKSGVYNEKRCSQTRLDHGVLAVGYGMDGDNKYWIVKNSWGGTWGQKGYLWMSRDKNNQCGIATAASYPIV